jgi:cyclase
VLTATELRRDTSRLDHLGAIYLTIIGVFLLTSMDGDGTQAGYDLALTRAVAEAVEVPVIASGGAGCVEHIAEALTEGKASAALLASLLHDGLLTIEAIKSHLLSSGVEVRPLET